MTTITDPPPRPSYSILFNRLFALVSRPVVLATLAALLIRLVSFATFDFIDSGGGSDSVTYLLLAKNLFGGQGFTEFGIPHLAHPPLYPILIGLVGLLTGDLLQAGLLVSVLAGALTVIPAFSLGRRLFGPRTGLYSAWAVALFPILVYGSAETFAESLYTFVLLSGLALFWRGFQDRTLVSLLFSGFSIGLAFLTHPSGLAFAPLLLIFLVGGQLSAYRRSWSKIAASIALFLVGFCLVCLPYWIFLHRATGAWSLSGSSYYQDLTFRLTQAEGAPESEIIYRHMESIYHPGAPPPSGHPIGLFSLALYRPAHFLSLVRFNLQDGYREVVKTARFLAVSPGLLMGMLTGFSLLLASVILINLFRPRRRAAVVFLSLMFLPATVFVVITIEHRYFYPFVPLGLILLSWMAAGIRQWLLDRGSRRRTDAARLVIMAAAAAMLLGSSAIVWRKWRKVGVPYEYKLLGEWMREELPLIAGENVMMFRMGISYYAGCRWNVFYWGDYPGLLRYLRERGIRYLVVDDYKLHMIHPGLRFLLSSDDLPPEAELVKEISFQGRKIRLLLFDPSRIPRDEGGR